MKTLTFITIFNLLFVFVGKTQTYTCSNTGPIYYTTKTLSMYEEMSSESAIKKDVPNGTAVEVTESFFGDSGWWEICYQGTNGWVRKSGLTRKQPIATSDQEVGSNVSSNNIDTDTLDTDVGFSPFLAKVSSTANFRSQPSKNSCVIKQLTAGTQLYVFSTEDAYGFYKAIDIKSGKIGWVSKSLVQWTSDAEVNYNSNAFQSTGTTTNSNADVTISNKSAYHITLIVDGETLYISPNSTISKSITPGNKYYIATAPGVIPSSGKQTFNSYSAYSWEFWVETK